MIRFEKHPANPVIARTPGTFHSVHVANPDLLFFKGRYHLYFRGQSEEGHDQIGVATCEPDEFDGVLWHPSKDNPVIRVGEDFDSGHILDPAAMEMDGKVFLYYSAHHVDWKKRKVPSWIGLAVSKDGIRFEKIKPVVQGTCPEIVIHDGKPHLFFQRRTEAGFFEIHCIDSRDGVHFDEERRRTVLTPSGESFDRFSISTARILKEGDWFYMTFGGCDRYHDYPLAIGLARSRDLTNWERYPGNPVLERGRPGDWDEGALWFATVHKEGGTYYLWYEGAGAGPKADASASLLCRDEDYGGYEDTSFSQIGLATYRGDSLGW